MKKLMLGLFVTTSMILTGCSDDDDNGNVIGGEEETITYNLYSSNDASVVGTTIFQMNTDNTTSIIVEADADMTTEDQTLHLHSNSAAETGERVFTLNPFDEDGVSTTFISNFDDGSDASFQILRNFDGYVDVHNAEDAEHLMYADIGGNQLTGEAKMYSFKPENGSEVGGTITLERRMNNSTLATVNMTNTSETETYPIAIYEDNAIDGETSVFDLEAMNEFNMSQTQIEKFGDEEMTYNDLMNYDGHIRVGQGTAENTIATADIGQNELSGNSTTYNMFGIDGTENGTFTLWERLNGETIAEMQMNNTIAGVNHASFINSGVYGETGNMPTVTLNSVNGATGMARTNLTSLDADDNFMDYNAWLDYNGNVTAFSTTDPTSGVASYANIGVNAQ